MCVCVRARWDFLVFPLFYPTPECNITEISTPLEYIYAISFLVKESQYWRDW